MPRPALSVRPAYDAQSLTDVAIQVFQAKGYDATRMEHIAKAANIATSSIYHHVANKEELLGLALRRVTDALAGILADYPAGEAGPLARLELVLRRLVETDLRLHAEIGVFLQVRGNTELERWAKGERRAFQDRVVEMVAAARAAGELAVGVEPGLFVRLVLGMVNSVVDWYRADGTWSQREIADAVVRTALGGNRRA